MNRLSPREVRLVCRRYRDEEKSIPEIMAEFGKTNISIYKVLKRNKIPLRKALLKCRTHKLSKAMKEEIIQMGIERINRKVIAQKMSEKYKIEISPNNISLVLSNARMNGVEVPYFLENYVRSAPSFRRVIKPPCGESFP